MSIKKIVAIGSIFAVSIFMLFVYPSSSNLLNAGQSKSNQNATALTNAHRISVSSEAVIAHYFGKDVVDKVMKQPGCVGVRMYYGKHTNGKSGFIFIGVDKNGRDMVSTLISGPASYCPPICND